MIRILQWIYFLYACIGFVLLILLILPFALLLKMFPKRMADTGMFLMLKFISNIWFILNAWVTKNHHREKIDFNRSYLFMPTHRSYLDAAVLYTSMLKPFKTLGKIEIERTPLYGFIYKMVVITVDRSSVTAKANSFRKMKKEMETGISIGIFPEGTFPLLPSEELLPFHKGAFSLALMQQVDILPILYLDTARRMHPSKLFRLTPGVVRVVFLPPLSIAAWSKETLEELIDKTQAYMQACLNYSKEHSPESLWDFATEWQKNNNLVSCTPM